MAEILKVSKAMFSNREDWEGISDLEKSECFFIFNRYFSKKYPKYSQLLNKKNIDKISAMNIWFTFMSGKPYPNWFWDRGKKSKSDLKNKIYKNTISDIDKLELSKNLEISLKEVNQLIKWYPELVIEEINYYKSNK